MILPADHVLRAVINARFPVPLLLLVCFWSYLFHTVMLPYQVGDVPLTCIAAVDYVSGIHVVSSDYWLASFFARLFQMTNFTVKHSIMTPEMVENFCNDYYIPNEVHPVAPGRDKTITQFPEEMGLLDFIKTADPRKVQAVEVQKKDDQVKLLESTSHCFMSLVTPAAGGSSSAAAPEVSAPEVSAPVEVEPENVVPEDTYLDLTGPDEVVATQSGKSKRKRLGEQSDTLPAKQLRKDHPSLATGTGGKTLAGLRQLMPTSPLVSRPSFQADIQAHVVQSARIADVPVYTAVATVTSARENVGVTPTCLMNSAEAERWYVTRWNITNDSLLDDGFSCRTLVDRVAPWLFLYPPKSRVEHELELKEKLKGKCDARSRLLEEKDLEILRLKSYIEWRGGERRDRSGVSSSMWSALTDLTGEATCAEGLGSLITSLTSERDRLTSERLEGELYPTYLATLARRRWFLTHRIQLAVLKCFKSPEYQGILGHALGRAVDFGMHEGLEAGYEHGVAGTPLSAVEAYNPEAARTSYFDAVRALEDVDFPLVNLLKSKKDAGMDEVLDCFILDGPLANLPEAAHLQPCLEQLFVPIYHSNDKAIVGETSLSFALLNVHSRAEGAKKHAAALRQLMMEIVSNPLSS
ncbi:hypothetical protein Tco_0892568 [Tanacetum coccineum]|uniref:Uncharacterized protein n=1 Tax=Tanacetum coccineum TaxID=301880 RepID=A0ABQ5C6J3_9ASTR